MPNDQPWRDLAKYSNDELVDQANQALLHSDALYQKQIGFEMWRRQANTGDESGWQATRSSLITLTIALVAISFAVSATDTLVWVAALAIAALILAAVAVEDRRRSRDIRKRRWPHM